MQNLSEEICLEIFTFVVFESLNIWTERASFSPEKRISESSCFKWIRISHVCRDWRRGFLQDAPIWIDLARPAFASAILQGRQARGKEAKGILTWSLSTPIPKEPFLCKHAALFSQTLRLIRSFDVTCFMVLDPEIVDMTCYLLGDTKHVCEEADGTPLSVLENLLVTIKTSPKPLRALISSDKSQYYSDQNSSRCISLLTTWLSGRDVSDLTLLGSGIPFLDVTKLRPDPLSTLELKMRVPDYPVLNHRHAHDVLGIQSVMSRFQSLEVLRVTDGYWSYNTALYKGDDSCEPPQMISDLTLTGCSLGNTAKTLKTFSMAHVRQLFLECHIDTVFSRDRMETDDSLRSVFSLIYSQFYRSSGIIKDQAVFACDLSYYPTLDLTRSFYVVGGEKHSVHLILAGCPKRSADTIRTLIKDSFPVSEATNLSLRYSGQCSYLPPRMPEVPSHLLTFLSDLPLCPSTVEVIGFDAIRYLLALWNMESFDSWKGVITHSEEIRVSDINFAMDHTPKSHGASVQIAEKTFTDRVFGEFVARVLELKTPARLSLSHCSGYGVFIEELHAMEGLELKSFCVGRGRGPIYLP